MPYVGTSKKAMKLIAAFLRFSDFEFVNIFIIS